MPCNAVNITVRRLAVVLPLALVFVFGPEVNLSQAQESAAEFRQQLYRARSGQLNAQLYVANEYEKGRVVEQNMQQAVGWYMRAARKGNLEAQFRLAKILHAGGKGVKRQPASAVKFYKAAAKRGHPDAQNWLGYAYQHGHGVVKNPSIAADWYKNAAGHGQAEAQNNLGLMYLTGKGVEQDHKTAAEWFQKAADQNHAMALNNLAGMYEAGWGVERSADKARELYQTAAVTGNQTAIANLKRLGQPVPGGAEGKAGQRARSLRGTTDPDDPTVYETNTDGSATYGTSTDETATDEPASDGTLSRGDVVTTDPNRPMTEQELERWLAQNDPEDSRWPSVQNSGQDPFGVLQKNWDKVNKQRKRRKRKAPSDSLR